MTTSTSSSTSRLTPSQETADAKPSITAEAIEALLPQTQCRQCGFDGCAQYAAAIAAHKAPINRCAPGGASGIEKLARATGENPIALDPEYGQELPYSVARIRAQECIGCGLCAAACPVEVVSGAPKHLYAVIESYCTGCGLCVCACPVNAVDMVEAGRNWTQEDARAARQRYIEARERRARIRRERTAAVAHDAVTRASVLAAVLAKAGAKQP